MNNLFIRTVGQILLTGFLLFWQTSLYAQDTEQRISVKLKDATLKEFIKAIENTTDYSFIYGEEVEISKPITIESKEKTVEETLRLAFLYQPISFRISGKHILLQKIKPEPQTVRKVTISGHITDKSSSETLIGTNIFEKHRRQGTSSNSYGFYTLTLPVGEVEIGFSYLGYSTQIHRFYLERDTVLPIKLATDNQLEEVVVVSDRVETGLMATHAGALDIPMSQIRQTPSILGESDVMKTIQHLPGVQAGTEGSAGLYVRGGSPDQNLILLDGVPIYNVDHIFGFFSVFTPEAMKKVTLFKGSFPARFGGRLSSVIDVRTNDGDMKNYHGSFSLGLLSTKLNVEGPIVKDRTSFNVSLRRSYLDVLARPFMSDDTKFRYYFYDINAKVNHKFSEKSRLYLSLYHGKDYFDCNTKDNWGVEEDVQTKDDVGIEWGNLVVAARWNKVINNKLFSNTTVAYNQYKMNTDSKSHIKYRGQQEHYLTNYNSGIKDWSAQIDFDYTPVPRHHIKFGGSYIFHEFHPEVMTAKVSVQNEEVKEDSIYHAISNKRLHANEFSLYFEDNFDLTNRLRTNIGVHLSAFHVDGKSYFSAQPRLSARYQISNNMVIKASYSKMNQYINLLTSAPISMPTDLWVPVTKNIKPMRSHQYSLGAYYTGWSGWELSAEGYYKSMTNILEYKDATRYIGSSASWESKVEMGKGRSFGVEFMAQRTIGKSTGWIAYTWSKSDRKFEKGGINQGERFPFKYDRRHQIDIVFNHKFSDKVDIGASWYFATGGTTTIAREITGVIRPTPEGLGSIYTWFYKDLNSSSNPHIILENEYVEGRNNYRLPASHRLNVGINFHKKTKNGVRTWNFSVYNMYNAMNPTFVHRANEMVLNESTGEIKTIPILRKMTLLPFIPSVTYTYKF